MDNIVGTSGDDTINGVVGTTFQLTDAIDGGAGTDTLNLIAEVAAATVSLPAAAIKNVEVINARVLTSDGVPSNVLSIDASLIPGVKEVWSDRSNEGLAVTGLADGAVIGMRGDGLVTNGKIDYAYATPTAAQTIAVHGGTKSGDITATASTGVTTATITSTGAANKVGTIKLDSAGGNTVTSLTVDAATNLEAKLTADDFASTAALTVKGAAASVNLGSGFDGKTIDASGLTGGLTIALSANATSFQGGQGNDVVTTAAIASTASIDAGAGDADVLVVGTATDTDTAAEGALYKGFEVLRTADSQNMAHFTNSAITAIQMEAATNKVLSNVTAAQAANITVRGDQETAFTVTLADATGAADAVTLDLKSATATSNNVDIAALSIAGVETLNVVASTGSANDASNVTFAGGGANTLTAINVSGAANTKFSGSNTSKAITFNSTATGAVTLEGNWVSGSSFTLGGGADTITLGTGFNTYNSGAGDDTFNATVAQLNTGADYNVIDGGEGTDTLNINNGNNTAVTIVDNNLSKISGIEKVVIASSGSGAQSIQTGGWFDAAFKANGIDLTTESGSGDISIDMTSFTGAAKITTTSTTGVQTIQTGSAGGNDTVTASAATGIVSVTTGAGDDTVSITNSDTVFTSNTVSTGAGNDTITLSVADTKSVATTITGGAGADVITLSTTGTSTDTIVIGNTDSGITLATADVIKNFTTSVDKLKMGTAGDDSTAGAINYHEAATAVANFDAALAAANTILAQLASANTGDVEAYAFQWDATNGYLFNDTDGNGTADQVIVLVGITGAGIAAGDIIA